MVAVLAVLNGVWMENKAIKVIVSSYYVIMILSASLPSMIQ